MKEERTTAPARRRRIKSAKTYIIALVYRYVAFDLSPVRQNGRSLRRRHITILATLDLEDGNGHAADRR
jgi:hypothetical protein